MLKFIKDIYCTNCSVRRTYRFDRGTDLRGRKIECDNCGVHIEAAPAPVAGPAAGSTANPSLFELIFGKNR